MATKEYTMAEVKQHIDSKSSWFVIHNSVYDVTAFLNEHPGGEEVLLEQAGRNASEAFEDVGHSSDAREMMLKYKVGELVESERQPVNEKGPHSWSNESADQNNGGSSWTSWLIPVTLGLLATILYRFYVSSAQASH
ncbi:cytochrome b5 [Chrysoperla carnea]|uniref:cytochrome b5 n=1 Tax=Chrysoperla carnea TaxID=189513 RepID=UPI001D08B795|nr:cytochrome b5 [Chrysoperla carnea]